jgi:hypothetical protein
MGPKAKWAATPPPQIASSPRVADQSFAISTCHSCLHVRENDLENLEMAASLDFLHFHQAGWK